MATPQAKICIYPASDPSLATPLSAHLAATPLYFNTLADLLTHLRSPDTADDIVVLAPADMAELDRYRDHKRLQDRRLVLIVPDGQEATLSLAHMLAPRYLCQGNGVGADLAAVLNKMAGTSRRTLALEGAT